MNIIIVGGGKVGEKLAAQLNVEGNNVTIVDQNPIKAKTIANKYDLMGVIGNGASRSTQKEAGIDKTDLLVAVTGNDELNLLSCLMAKKSANCRTIARLKNPEYNSDSLYFQNELGLAMVINPELAAAKEIARILNFPSAIKIETFAKGRVELLTFKLPEDSRLVGMSVKDVAVKLRSSVTFCTVERGDEVFITNGNFVFEGKDIISIIASPSGAKAFFKKIDYQIQPIKSALIVGGGAITYYLLELLENSGISCTVVEKDYERCNELAGEFEKVTIINADPADEVLLQGIPDWKGHGIQFLWSSPAKFCGSFPQLLRAAYFFQQRFSAHPHFQRSIWRSFPSIEDLPLFRLRFRSSLSVCSHSQR